MMCRFEEQLNCFERNKIGYNFVFMFANPSYLPGEKKIPLKALQY
jgi:hypothetical protein